MIYLDVKNQQTQTEKLSELTQEIKKRFNHIVIRNDEWKKMDDAVEKMVVDYNAVVDIENHNPMHSRSKRTHLVMVGDEECLKLRIFRSTTTRESLHLISIYGYKVRHISVKDCRLVDRLNKFEEEKNGKS